MKKAVLLSVLSSAFVSQVFAGPKVIYGEDNRTEVYEASAQNQLLARSTATMISKNEMTRDPSRPGLVTFTQNTLSDWISSSAQNKSVELNKAAAAGIGFCPGTRFADQPNPGMCSGFLIAPDLVVTAGHCVDDPQAACEEYRWVFGFEVNKETKQAGVDVPEENIYKCKKVVSNALVGILGLDYGVIQLDRIVKDRAPLKVANSSRVADTQGLVVIGSPSGLPTKVAVGANVRTNIHPNFFVANLDTFQGNSGSAVFNDVTGVVEGILVRGEEDYVPNFQKMCVEANVCASNGCRGEDVSRMSSIPEVALRSLLLTASKTGNMTELNKILSLKTYIDFNLDDGKTALMAAASGAQNLAIKAILANGAEVNKLDAAGNTALMELGKVLKPENADALITLVDAGAKLEVKNSAGDTALLVAGRALNLEGAKLLIKAGANKNAVDANGENVLFSFVRQGNDKAVLELADLGVDIKPVMELAGASLKLKMKIKKIVKN